MHGQQRAGRARRDDDRLRGRRDGRPGGHDRDRGRHRRAERERDRHRGRRALRAGAAAPAARAGSAAGRIGRSASCSRTRPTSSRIGGWRWCAARTTGSPSPRRTSSCAAPATCSARASPACRRCGWRRCSSRATSRSRSGHARWPTRWSEPIRRSSDRPLLARLQRDFARSRGGGRRGLMRVIAGVARGVAARGAARPRHAADHRSREGDAVRDPRRARGRRSRPRPVRRQRRDRDRGAVARRGARHVRRARAAGARGAAHEPRADAPRASRRRVEAGDVERFLRDVTDGPWELVFVDPPYEERAIVAPLRAVVPHLAPGAPVVVKHFWRTELPEVAGPGGGPAAPVRRDDAHLLEAKNR